MCPARHEATRAWIARCALAGAVLAALAAGCQETTDPVTAGLVSRSASDMLFDAGAEQPPNATTLYAMARILAARGRDQHCETVLRRIINENPTFMPAYCDLAELHMRHGRLDAAMKILAWGLDHRPTDPIMLNNLGMCHLQQGRQVEALACFTRAAGRIPDDARYRANMATALGLQGRYAESMALYTQVLPPSDAHRNLAVLCRIRNDRSRAERELSLAEALGSPEHPGASQ